MADSPVDSDEEQKFYLTKWDSDEDGELNSENLERKLTERYEMRFSKNLFNSGYTIGKHSYEDDKVNALLFGRAELIVYLDSNQHERHELEDGHIFFLKEGTVHRITFISDYHWDGESDGELNADNFEQKLKNNYELNFSKNLFNSGYTIGKHSYEENKVNAILSGHATLTIFTNNTQQEKISLIDGDVFYFPGGTNHSITFLTDCEFYYSL